MLVLLWASPVAWGQANFITVQVDNPYVTADGSSTTAVRLYAYYQNANGVTYPAAGVSVAFSADYGQFRGYSYNVGANYYTTTNSQGQASLSYNTIDTGGYHVYGSALNMTNSVSVSPGDPGPSWATVIQPWGQTFTCNRYPAAAYFAWGWSSTRKGAIGNYSPYELIGMVSANNCPVYPYNRQLTHSATSSSQQGSLSFYSTPCNFCAYNIQTVALYILHQAGSYTTYEYFATSQPQSFYVVFQ